MTDDSFRALPGVLKRTLGPETDKPAPFACCPHCGDPLISTFRFPGAEFYCVACEATFGFLAPVGKPPTPDLEARYEELQAAFRERFPEDR
jgi:hypothetical protein